MEVQKAYEIFTDASYDDVTKVGTYAIVIMQENKVAHKHSYLAFQKLKIQNNKNDIILIDKYLFLELLQILNSNYYKVISYLFQILNEEKLILKTQREIAKTLEISTYNINKIFKQLIKLNILGKIKNGKYILLI